MDSQVTHTVYSPLSHPRPLNYSLPFLNREAMSSVKNAVHVLVFPFPAQGHMLALLDLTQQLSLRGLKITIVITPKNLPILVPLLSANPSIQTLVLPFPTDPSIPPGVENVRDIGNRGNIPIISALSKLQDPIIQWFKSQDDPPVALLSDFFLGWTYQLANQMGIPRIVFHSCAAFLSAVFDHLWSNPEAVKPGSEIKFDDLPRAPGFAWHQLPSLYQRYRELEPADSSYEVIKTLMGANASSWAFVFNSFHDLEGEFLQHLNKKPGRPRVYGVGPLNMITGGSGELTVNDDLCESKHTVISWLDECDDNSVLYVCFGSQKWLKKAQMEALAMGLERSGVRFVWVVKPLTAQQVADGFGWLPDGFEDRVLGRGFVIKGWAPQTAILSHRAVGGFLSHCGWNSALEAIVAGVMILGWPMEADQFLDAKLLADYKGAAVLACEGEDTVPDPTELARKITESMHGSAVERVRAKELRDQALEAMKAGGTSNRDLDELVQELTRLKM